MIYSVLVVVWVAIFINNPFVMALLFLQILVLISSILRVYCSILGFIIFLLFVGGVMILISYCVMLLPISKYGVSFPIVLSLTGYLFGIGPRKTSAIPYGLLFRARIILMISLLLYLVMLSIVEIIDYSSGIIKLYDTFPLIHFYNDYYYHYLLYPFNIKVSEEKEKGKKQIV